MIEISLTEREFELVKEIITEYAGVSGDNEVNSILERLESEE